MKDKPLMKCGHTVICDCTELADENPSLQGRKAKCSFCGQIKDSDYDLPFFEYKPDKEYDEYYCGCGGWD